MKILGGALVAAAAIAIAAPVADAAPRSGTWWAGDSRLHLDFQVKQWRSGPIVTGAIAEAQGGCAARKADIIGSGFVRRNRFRMHRRLLGGRVEQRLTGRFSSRGRASGTYREIDTRFNRRCDTGTLRWTARPVRRKTVRDGTWSNTTPGQRVSFLIQQRGRLISRVNGDAVGCDPRYPKRFSGPAEPSLTEPNGTFSIPLFALPGSFFGGRFNTATTASGTYRVVFTSSAGTPTCESGVQSWSGRFG